MATQVDEREPVRRLLSGLVRGDDVHALAAEIAELHPRNNTFPGEVFIGLGALALDLAGADRHEPIPYEGLCSQFLPECEFRGRENARLRFAVLAAAARRGGLEADLLDEVSWWHTDDFWWYGLCAAVALIRAGADRLGVPVAAFAPRILEQSGLSQDCSRANLGKLAKDD